MNCMSCIQHTADLVYYFSRQHFKRKIKLVGKKCNSYRIRPQSCDFCFWASIERSFLFWFYWKQQKVLSSFNVLSWARQHLVWASCFWFWLCSWHCKLCIIFLMRKHQLKECLMLCIYFYVCHVYWWLHWLQNTNQWMFGRLGQNWQHENWYIM